MFEVNKIFPAKLKVDHGFVRLKRSDEVRRFYKKAWLNKEGDRDLISMQSHTPAANFWDSHGSESTGNKTPHLSGLYTDGWVDCKAYEDEKATLYIDATGLLITDAPKPPGRKTSLFSQTLFSSQSEPEVAKSPTQHVNESLTAQLNHRLRGKDLVFLDGRASPMYEWQGATRIEVGVELTFRAGNKHTKDYLLGCPEVYLTLSRVKDELIAYFKTDLHKRENWYHVSKERKSGDHRVVLKSKAMWGLVTGDEEPVRFIYDSVNSR